MAREDAGSRYQLRIATDQDKEQLVEFLKKYFYVNEPLNEYLYEENKEYSLLDRGHTHGFNIGQGLTVIAITLSNEIIGVCANTDKKKDAETKNNPNAPIEIHPSYPIIRKLLNKVIEEASQLIKSNEDENEMSINIISVHSDWRKNGVGTALAKYAINLAKEKGYQQISAICTSAYSSRLLGNLGFKCMYSKKYEDYKENEKIIFVPKMPHAEVQIVLLQI